MGISGYKKIATTKKSVTSLSYKDKTVKAGKTYRYKVRTYLKVGKKKYYSAFTDYELPFFCKNLFRLLDIVSCIQTFLMQGVPYLPR